MLLRLRSLAVLVAGIVVAFSLMLRAQQPAPIASVDADVIQLPVLLLFDWADRVKAVDPATYFVSRDAGPAFHPLHVRQQADDPMSVGILLDVDTDRKVMPQIASTIAALAPDSLHPNDHVTVFALDCNLARPLQDVPAEPKTLQAAVDLSLIPALAAMQNKHAVPCTKRVQLWDAMGVVVNDLGHLPGRRVLLAITDGNDHGSAVKWNELLNYAQINGVAVFGYHSNPEAPSQFTLSGSADGTPTFTPILPPDYYTTNSQQHFNSVCAHSGGMIIGTKSGPKTGPLATFIARVRGRYILDLPRFANETPAKHSIVVSIPPTSAFLVRPAGVSVFLPGPNDGKTPAQSRAIPPEPLKEGQPKL